MPVRSGRGFVMTGGLAVMLVALVAPASALALRYASPAGTSTNDCQSVGTACDLTTAIQGIPTNMPTTGEEVIVEPGTYTLGADITEGNPNLNIHGVLDQPRPVINGGGFSIHIYSGTINYLDLESTGGSDINLSGNRVAERLFIRASGSGSTPACQCAGLIRDSVVVSVGTEPALGIEDNGGTANGSYRNVTAYATNAAAPAIQILQDQLTGTLTFDAYNVIARNGAGGTDVVANGAPASITFHHSNYGTSSGPNGGTVQDAPGDPHQSAAPAFTNASAADFSEVAGSPTIDAGITDPLDGALDFAGNARTLGASTDIGAYEFVPPPVLAPKPSNAFSFGKLTKHRKKGTATLATIVPGPGVLTLGGNNLAGVRIGTATGPRSTTTANAAGTYYLLVKATGKTKRTLKKKGKAKVIVTVTFTPTGGDPNAQSTSVKLIKRR